MMKDDIPAAAATAVVGANIAEAGGGISNPLTLFLKSGQTSVETSVRNRH